MRFKFRLQPMVKIVERRIKTLKAELANVVADRQGLEKMIEEHEEASLAQDQRLAQVEGGLEATMFFAERQGRHRRHSQLVQRLHEFVAVEEALNKEIVSMNYELYRLDKCREKAKARFVDEMIKEEDKALDEMAILRYKAE